MRDYEFDLQASLPAFDAVAGRLVPARAGEKERAVLLVLTEGLGDYKRREKLQRAREALMQGQGVAFPGGAETLSLTFADKSRNAVKGSLQHPDFVGETIDLLSRQTVQPLITLDCQTRECFWAALRIMGADSRDLFAVAELGALKTEARSERVAKPVGEAHLLCGDLARFKGVSPYGDFSPRDYIHMIRRSTKVKLPSIDLDEQILASHFLRDLESSTGERKELSFLNRLVKMRMALRFIGREKPETVILSQDEWSGMKKIQDAMRGLDGDIADKTYERRFSDVPRFLVLRGDPREVLTRKYKEHYQFDADRFDFDHLLQFHDGYGAEELRFRAGIHANPFPATLFETQLTKGIEKEPVLSVSSLVTGGADELTVYNFIKPAAMENAPYALHPNKMLVSLEQGRAQRIAIVDMQQHRTLYEGGRLSFSNAGDMAFMHVLSAIARMNEPDYAPVMYETQRRGYTDIAKGRFPYFDYINIDSFGPTTSFVRIGAKGDAEEVDSKRRHLVRGHPRRLRDEAGRIREIIIIPPHLRGDESKGFVAKGYNLDK